jgi:hypothetical protein
MQGSAFVHGDVIRFIAFNFILRFFFTRMNRIALESHVRRNDPKDPSAHWAGFGIPTHMVADVKAFRTHIATETSQTIVGKIEASLGLPKKVESRKPRRV